MSMLGAIDPTWWVQPVTLQNAHVSLAPLLPEHAQALGRAATDGELWRLFYTSVPTPASAEQYVEQALDQQRTGWAVPFVVRDPSGEVVGTTRYCNIDAANQRVEIGWTWYAQRVQRSALNTAAKLLLLTHAFETLGAGVVELRTSFMNHRSRAAIARLGAKQDGILRNHMKLPGGGYRDTVVFSIIESEWLAVKRNLQFLLESGGQR
ncbi:MAG: GNAT family N-acetyltransferase [Xanthomonadales bacterium]|nr:GNAT family N-acetyltransferase [Xanthomonadales bacterium]MBP7623253.1 GNAT family N-acetyltransferase [Xanthomonadales bacterium]